MALLQSSYHIRGSGDVAASDGANGRRAASVSHADDARTHSMREFTMASSLPLS